MQNRDLEKSIFCTIVYYDIFGLPLTSFEVYKYLIRNSQFAIRNSTSKLSDILEVFEKSNFLQEKIGKREGFHFLKGRDGLVEGRIESQKVADLKWRKLRRFLQMLQGFPFIKLVLVTGSLAIGNVKPESDFDILIIAGKGRIWTTRFLTTLFFWMLGLRRSDRHTRDKMCLNHYLSDEALEIEFKNLYEAQAYARFIPVIENEPGFYQEFCTVNAWIGDYVASWPQIYADVSVSDIAYQRKIKSGKITAWINRVLVWMLGGRLGDRLERTIKKIQQKHIEKHPLTLKDKAGGRVTATDQELEFHPELHSQKVLAEYSRRIAELAVAS